MLETTMIEPFFPMATVVYFQCVFAAITVILVAGSLLGQMSFMAWMLFVPLSLNLSYTVGAFSIWEREENWDGDGNEACPDRCGGNWIW
jgi:Amt family ammonium transporter